MLPSLGTLLDVITVAVLVYFVAINLFYFGTGFVAFRYLRRNAVRVRSLAAEELISAAGAPPITLIAPTYNEELTVVASLRSLLTLEYPAIEIIAVNDGSTDGTLDVLIDAFDLQPASRAPTASIETKAIRLTYRSRLLPNLWVIDKVNGGKADALNAGIDLCRTPFFCAIDADSLLDRDALMRIVRPFLEDDATVAAGGVIRVANGCEVRAGEVTKVLLPDRRLPALQVVEYLRAFLSGRIGWSALGMTLIVSGAFGLFRRSTVVEAGGYRTDTVGEDMELVVRLHRYCLERKRRYRILFVPDPVAWTEVPETLGGLGRQRDRWQRGLFDSLLLHMKMLFNPRYGRVGTVAFPFFFVFELFGPLLEILGYAAFAVSALFGRLSLLHVAAFLLLSVVLGMLLSITAVAQEELAFRRYGRYRDLVRLFTLAVIENFGYRQLTTLWRVRGLYRAVRGVKSWGEQSRRGFTVPRPSP